MSEIKRNGKDLLRHLRHAGKIEYGTVVLASEVRSVLGLDYPEIASKQTFDRLALQELAAVDYVRNVLLGEGMYFGQSQGDYRIFLPSENAKQIRRYTENADAKLKRALKLWRNAPGMDGPGSGGPGTDSLGARMLLKREGIKSRSIFGKSEERND